MRIIKPLRDNRGLCRQIKNAHGKSSDIVVTVVPESLVDENLLKVAGGGKKHKPAGTFGRTRLKKCHWQGVGELLGYMPNQKLPGWWCRPLVCTVSCHE